MATSHDSNINPGENTYVIDAESSAEMARLMRQDHLLTQGMGGLFPENLDLSGVQRILDVACGPGGWVLEVAFEHADIEVVGIDISEKMIAYAQAQAKVQKLENASFHVMNALRPLDFPDASFDLVNARLIVAFMLPNVWPTFIQECLRILRPGGILRFTELEWGPSNMPIFEKMCSFSALALHKAGQSFSPNGIHIGVLAVLRRLLVNAKCQNIGQKAHIIDFSYDTDAHEGFYYDFSTAFKLLQPFIISQGLATNAEWDTLYAQAMAEMQSEDFCAVLLLLTVWGYKPL